MNSSIRERRRNWEKKKFRKRRKDPLEEKKEREKEKKRKENLQVFRPFVNPSESFFVCPVPLLGLKKSI